MRIGSTMMCEQADPRQLVRDVVRAEELGFDFAVISDHYNPWLTSQGHSGYGLGLGWKVNSELPGPSAFEAASQFVRPEDVAKSIPCGSDVQTFVDMAKPFAEAGFTDLALVQIGGDQQDAFFDWAPKELLPALREL